MISLRKFLTAAGQEPGPGDSMRVVRLLIQGIALHAVEGDTLDHQAFRQDMQQQLEVVETNPAPAELLVSIGAILKSLESYNSRTTRHLRMLGTELHQMIGMLTRTVATLGSGSEESIGRLCVIEGQIEKTSGIDDVRVLKLRLGECLDSIRTEAKRQKAASSRVAASLEEEIRGSQDRISAAGAGLVLDPTTGLPARAAAASALEEWAGSPNPPYAALFVVDRLHLINARFGYGVGDRAMKAYVEDLRTHLLPGDQIFRWSGPSFLALLSRPDRIEKVRDHLRFALPAKIERSFELTNRSILLSISASWAVFPITSPAEGLIEQLDAFLASHNPAAQA